jgi:hypothetical protein
MSRTYDFAARGPPGSGTDFQVAGGSGQPAEKLFPHDFDLGWGLDAEADDAPGNGDNPDGNAQAGKGDSLIQAAGKDEHGELLFGGCLLDLERLSVRLNRS